MIWRGPGQSASPAALAVTNAARVIFLIRIGKKGWESRVRQGR